MKKNLALTVAVGIGAVAALSGCSTTGATSGSSGSGSDSGSYSIQFVNPLPNYPAWKTVGVCMGQEAKKEGVNLTQSGPSGSDGNTNQMISQIQSAVANKKQGIITFPASDAFGPLLQQAQKKGIVTATLYGSGTADSGADINVGVDFEKLGETYVKSISKIPGEKKVGLVAASDTGVGKAWMDGFRKAAEADGHIEVVGSVYTADDSSKALGQSSALLTAHPEINVIATHMGTVTPGAIAAIKAKGLTGKVDFVGNGPDNGGQAALKDGSAYSMLVQALCNAGKDALKATVKHLKAGKSSGVDSIQIGTDMATKSNIDSLVKNGWS